MKFKPLKKTIFNRFVVAPILLTIIPVLFLIDSLYILCKEFKVFVSEYIETMSHELFFWKNLVVKMVKFIKGEKEVK